MSNKQMMANTYTQIHLHVIFAVKDRECLIEPAWKNDLYQYISGIIRSCNHKVIIINGMPDHIHLCIGLRPYQALSELIQYTKGHSAKWVNNARHAKRKFEWQLGFGAFSFSKSQLPVVVNYILNQEEHHKKKSFVDEYREMLEKFEVPYSEQFIFKSPE